MDPAAPYAPTMSFLPPQSPVSGTPASFGPPPGAAAFGAPATFGQPAMPGAPASFGPPAVPGAPAPFGPPAPGAPQPMAWPVPQPVKRNNRVAIIAGISVGALLLIACFGAVGSVFLLDSGKKSSLSTPSTRAPLSPLGGGNPSAAPGSATDEPAEPQQGPQPSSYPAEKRGDLDRVCDENIYYPTSPKRAGKAPHPIVLLVNDGSFGSRTQNGTYYFDEGLGDAARKIWAAEDPRKVQTVACMDRVSVGKKLRNCKYDDPKPETISLMRATWRLRVYEAATGKKLLDKSMSGDDQECPFSVLVGADRKIYAEVSDRAVVNALRKFVTK